jgi:hypothetical protein
MRSISDIHRLIRLLLNKEQTGHHSPEEFDDLLDVAQMSVFNDLYGNRKQYASGRPVPPVALGVTQGVNDALLPFRVALEFNANPYTLGTNDFGTGTDGILRIPSNYIHLSTLYTTTFVAALGKNKTQRVTVLNEDQLADRLDSFLLTPSETHAVAILAQRDDTGTRIQFYPNTGKTGYGSYMRRPLKPKFSYTLAGRVVTYDQATSVQLEWGEEILNEVILQTLALLGVNLQDMNALQYAESKLQAGV